MAPKKLLEGYADVASYSSLFDSMHVDAEIVSAVLEVMQPQAIVEIGCGSGRLLPLYLRTNANDILGIDIEPRMVAAFSSSGDVRVRAKVGDMREPIFDLEQKALVIIGSSLLKHLAPTDRRRTWRALALSLGGDQALFVDHCALFYGVEGTTTWASYADTLQAWWPDAFLPILKDFEWRKEVHDQRETLYFRRTGEPSNRIEGYRYDLDAFVGDAASEGFRYFAIADRYPACKRFPIERRIGLMVRSVDRDWAETARRIRARVYCD